MNIFPKEKFGPMSSQPTNKLNEHVCYWEENYWVVGFFRFFESGSFLSLFLFFLLVLLSENGDRVSCYFFYLAESTMKIQIIILNDKTKVNLCTLM